MYRVFVYNLDAIAEADAPLAAAESAQAAKSDPAMAEQDRANPVYAAFCAKKELGDFTSAKKQLLLKHELKTVDHTAVMLEHAESVIMNRAASSCEPGPSASSRAPEPAHQSCRHASTTAASASSRQPEPAPWPFWHGEPEQTQASSGPEPAQHEPAQLPSGFWSEWSEHGRGALASAESALAAAESALAYAPTAAQESPTASPTPAGPPVPPPPPLGSMLGQFCDRTTVQSVLSPWGPTHPRPPGRTARMAPRSRHTTVSWTPRTAAAT